MSDCSTAAMVPKELPKTCGKCGDDTPACNFLWERNQELEQRYQQISKVVKELYWNVCDRTDYGFEVMREYVPKLEALGVSVDG